MKRIVSIAAASAMAAAAGGGWFFEGKWGQPGSGSGEFRSPVRLAVAANDNVYVVDWGNFNLQYFTPTGYFLGKWGLRSRVALAFAPNHWRYHADVDNNRIEYFDENGSYRGKWGSYGSGPGQFNNPMGLGVAPNRNVYVADTGNRRIQYFTYYGSFLGFWGSTGYPTDVAVASSGKVHVAYEPDMGVGAALDTGYVYFADTDNHCIRYYTGNGSFLGKFGNRGTRDGEFKQPSDVAFSTSGARLYVADTGNYRVQYFRWTEPAVGPTSLGRVKALFR
jgi:tripartite motif-containing protein 71